MWATSSYYDEHLHFVIGLWSVKLGLNLAYSQADQELAESLEGRVLAAFNVSYVA